MLMKMNPIRGIIKGVKAFLSFLHWIIFYPFLMSLSIFCPNKVLNWTVFQKADQYYRKTVKPKLVGDYSSKTSFTFAHGILHFFIFIISFALAFWYYKSYINQSIEVKYKNLNIEVASYTPDGHIQVDSTTNKGLEFFDMGWSNEEVKDSSLHEQEKGLSFAFAPKVNERDTSFFTITVHADFDLKIDTAEIRGGLNNQLANHTIDYKIEQFGEKNGKYYIVINLISLPRKDYMEYDFPIFSFLAHNELYDKDDPPYLNYFIHFSFHSLLDLEPQKLSINNGLYLSFWDSHTVLEGISNYPYFNTPYELIEAKPGPSTNHPYMLIYNGESFKEAVQRGVYVKFANRDLLQKNDRRIFFWTVVIGALASFIFTVLIELFTKWRNLNLRSGNKDPYSDNE